MIPSWLVPLLPRWWPNDPPTGGTLAGGALTGTALDETLTAPNNLSGLTVDGLGGDDRLEDSHSWFDHNIVLSGGAGDDFYETRLLDTRVVELPGEGTDTLLFSWREEVLPPLPSEAQATCTLPPEVENLILNEGPMDFSRPADRVVDFDRNGVGNDLDNAIVGNQEGDNRIEGRAGDDSLQGFGGQDTLDGGDGTDVAYYVGNRSEYEVLRTADRLVVRDLVAGRDDRDVLQNIEVLRFADGDLRVDSPDLQGGGVTYHTSADIVSAADGPAMASEIAHDDEIAISEAEADARLSWSAEGSIATGTGVRDVFYLSARHAGLAQALGGPGDDVYIIRLAAGEDGPDPRVVEHDGEGDDTVWVSQSNYIPPASVENVVSMTERPLSLLGSDGANKLVGGPDADTLAGGSGDDVLYANGGNDLVVGGTGADALFGGPGADVFAWEPEHVGDYDRILDWEPGDRIDLRGISTTPNHSDVILGYGNHPYEPYAVSLRLDLDHDGIGDLPIVTLVEPGMSFSDVLDYIVF
jgi:Ca2+-binding RTX toxin-like protein